VQAAAAPVCSLHRCTARPAVAALGQPLTGRHSIPLLLHHFHVDRPPASRRTARNADTCAPDTVASVSQQNQTDRCRQTGRSDTDRREWIDEQTAASLQRSEFAAASAASSSPRLVPTGTSERARWRTTLLLERTPLDSRTMRAARLLDRWPPSVAFHRIRMLRAFQHRCIAIRLRCALVLFPASVRCGRMLGSAGAQSLACATTLRDRRRSDRSPAVVVTRIPNRCRRPPSTCARLLFARASADGFALHCAGCADDGLLLG